ncbi:hypothetical protein EVAR_94559_1 [Eumeta japonica]|uniref:Uncharacterized protein n=1 Tax=Eumeta variegata TaxID=151549 RepID=A0A4C1UVI4_EUMVA|nr:hypothetical protein EVAR_94559_1 [Eumeta japonica]
MFATSDDGNHVEGDVLDSISVRRRRCPNDNKRSCGYVILRKRTSLTAEHNQPESASPAPVPAAPHRRPHADASATTRAEPEHQNISSDLSHRAPTVSQRPAVKGRVRKTS